MVGEDAFYERAGDRDDRYAGLVRRLAVEDPEWTAAFLTWLRAAGNMRTAGCRFGHGPSGGRNRHTFGGLTDQAFPG